MGTEVLELHKPCPFSGCNSSDAYTVYKEDGKMLGKCHSCGGFTRNPYKCTGEDTETSETRVHNPSNSSSQQSNPEEVLAWYNEHPVLPLTDRQIHVETAERFGCRTGVDERDGITPIYRLFPVCKKGKITGYQKKDLYPEKKYRMYGDCKDRDPFGSHLIPERGKKLFITEGAEDAMSLYQVLKETSNISWEPAVIALQGSTGAFNSLLRYLSHVDYEEIVIALDQDKAGQETTSKICKAFPSKSYIATFSEKDPNEMLIKGKSIELKWAVLSKAKKFKPDNVVNPFDCWERYKNSKSSVFYPYPPFLQSLNDKCYGVKPGSIITWTGGTGCGKTQIMRELKYWFYTSTEEKIADISLEEDVSDSISGLISIHLNKRVSLPDVQSSEQEQKDAFDYLFSTGRFAMYDFFGGLDDTSLLSELHYLADTGHRFIFLDHLSIVVSEYASEGGERERIDSIMTKLARFVKATGVILFLVVHLRKNDPRQESFEEGAIPSLDDLRGSAAIKQLSWEVIGASRDQRSSNNPNRVGLHYLKARGTGRVGDCGYITFSDKTGRYYKS